MSLDPQDWSGLRDLGHRMIDDMFDDLASLRDRPVWRPMPDPVRHSFREPLPRGASEPGDVYDTFDVLVRPYAVGNRHPRFMGWVHGGGTAIGALAELLAAGVNANLGGRDHAPIEVERQVIRWAAELLGLPEETSGLLVTGTSVANLTGVLVARTAAMGRAVREAGIAGERLTAYAAAGAHGCIARAMDFAGLGSGALRLVECDADGRMSISALSAAVAADRAAGCRPFLVVGTAGTVDIGAIDPLARIAAVARSEGLWFHVDGAFGAMAALSPTLRPLLDGIERADSVAFDFHKWMQVPYDAGCILVRDPAAHLAAFDHEAAYLRREQRGLASGHPWPCDLGPDLSRGFRALKVWMTLKCYGADRLGEAIKNNCLVAAAMARRIDAEPLLDRAAPVALNVVCFRVRAPADRSDALQREIVADLQLAGTAVFSTTTIAGRVAIRAAVVNHRTTAQDGMAMLDEILRAVARRAVIPETCVGTEAIAA